MAPMTAYAGIDLGSSTSKITLAYTVAAPSGRREAEIIRVAFDGALDDPERPDRLESSYEFIAQAALEDGALVTGRQSLLKDHSIPLKTIHIHRSGITREGALKQIPGGTYLLNACAAGQITPEMEEDALMHHRLLYEMAQSEAKEIGPGIQITDAVFSYPNYLVPSEEAGDFEKYTAYYRKLVRPIWGSAVHFHFISEGQAAASDFQAPAIVERGRTPNTRFKIDTHSPRQWEQQLGSCGGSHLLNYTIKDKITEAYKSRLAPGNLAELERDFERLKTGIDWSGSFKTMHLSCQNPSVRFPLYPSALEEAFATAFNGGLKILGKQIKNAISHSQTFVIVFCGGSYLCKALRRAVDDLLAKIRNDNERVSFKHAYLAEFDKASSSAVSAGAALSLIHMPKAEDVLAVSVIGLHVAGKDNLESALDIGDNEAAFLFGEGYGPVPYYHTYFNDPQQSSLNKLALICDPNYFSGIPSLDRRKFNHRQKCFKPIQIQKPDFGVNSPMGPYDLGFSIPAAQLPEGYVRFYLRIIDEIASMVRFVRPICRVYNI
ncbi:hypothetical protein F4802DRAFT_593476 [Xylaria palmicola]|nr:hypothetical protein F4802DRAFT_593476 [Xylaria palmicola]